MKSMTLNFLLSIGIVSLQFFTMSATWSVVKIDNQSDLTFMQAARSDKDVEIQSISHLLTSSENDKNQNEIQLSPDLFFGSFGCCKIIAKTPHEDQFAITFFGDLTHRVASGRAPYADTDIDSRCAATHVKSPMIARVFMIQNGIAKLIGTAGYENENQQFALKLMGSDNNYQAVLTRFPGE